MKRLRTTLLWNIRLQWRNGFYYATFIVMFLWALLLPLIPTKTLAWLLPGLVLSNLLINTFYFIGGLLLLEKGEGTLMAQIVTPLRAGEYIWSKLLTVTALTLFENSVVTAVAYGLHLNFLLLALGITVGAFIFCLAGFLIVIRYDSVNEYLLPSIVFTTLLMLPMLAYFGLWQHWLLYLRPLQAPLLLLQAAWEPITAGQLIYATVYGVLWIGLLYRMAHNDFRQFIVAGQGVHLA